MDLLLRFLEASKSNVFDHFSMLIFVVFFPLRFFGWHSCSTQVLNILKWYLVLPQQAGLFLMRVFDLAVVAVAAVVFLVIVPVVGPVIVLVRVLVIVLALVLVLVLGVMILILAVLVAFVVAAVVVISVFVCVCFCSCHGVRCGSSRNCTVIMQGV